ncbi:MAG: hypothetical protein ABIZ49_06810, partial [Opitutaceae bacterium]
MCVIRDFTDARGLTRRAGENGIVRSMGLDLPKQEIWIEWQREDALERLHFPLRATDGPRNGRMRDYFELGEPEITGESPKPVAPSPEPLAPRRPEVPLNRFNRQHPPGDTSLEELSVACDCDPALHRPVLLEFSGVNACLRCGTVTHTRSVGDDSRFTGDSWQANLTVATPQPVVDWLALWPRAKIHRPETNRWPMAGELVARDFLFLPPNTRCETAAELAALETRLAHEQSPLSNGRRLFAMKCPAAKPPADVPDSLRGFIDIWEALRLRPESDLPLLLHFAQLRSAASEVAVALLLRRANAFDVTLAAMRSDDPARQSAGIALARAARPADPRLADMLIELMNGLSLAPLPDVPGRIVSCLRFAALLVVIADLKLA